MKNVFTAIFLFLLFSTLTISCSINEEILETGNDDATTGENSDSTNTENQSGEENSTSEEHGTTGENSTDQQTDTGNDTSSGEETTIEEENESSEETTSEENSSTENENEDTTGQDDGTDPDNGTEEEENTGEESEDNSTNEEEEEQTDPNDNLQWNKANLTNYESYPDPNSEECIEYNGCEWEGCFAALDDKQTEEWVEAHNIIAVHSKDFSKYKLKTLRLKMGNSQIDAVVYDMCADSDCDGCCTENTSETGFLIDIEKYSMQRFGHGDGIVEWACIDCN